MLSEAMTPESPLLLMSVFTMLLLIGLSQTASLSRAVNDARRHFRRLIAARYGRRR